MQIYNVYQSGKRLYIDEKEIPDNKIVVNKYDNMQQTLRLISDGTLPPRLYWALRNPKLSNKYFILKLINNQDLIVGTDISATPGLWDMLLIGTDEDYIIEGTDIDQSRLTYVSDHFGRLFVRDNFLEELDFEEQTSPTFKVFYDEIMFQLDNIPDLSDIPDKMSDLENDTNFISGVAFKDDGKGNVEIVGTTFSSGETEEGGGGSSGNVEVDDKLDEESTNPVQNKVVAKEVSSLKEKDKSLDKEVKALRERNAELEQTIEKLQIKTTTSPSPFHHITDSANMKVVDFGMEGKTEQESTSGKNLCDLQIGKRFNPFTGEIGELATYAMCIIETTEQMDVTVSIPSGEEHGWYLSYMYHNDTCTNIYHRIYPGQSVTITLSEGVTMLSGDAIINQTTMADEFKPIKVQIEAGSVATDYEPYTNGPSPNPDYPQEIVNAGKYNEATGRYEIGCQFCGDNYFDINKALDTNSYILVSLKDGTINEMVVPFKLKSNTTYAASADRNNNTYNLRLYNSDGVYYSLNNSDRFITTANDGMLYVGFYGISSGDLITRAEAQVQAFDSGQYTNIRINEGSVKLPYSEYYGRHFTLTSPVPLTKWDYLTKRDGVWGWSIWKLIDVFDGSETIRLFCKTEDLKTIYEVLLQGVSRTWSESDEPIYCNSFAYVPGNKIYTQSYTQDYVFSAVYENKLYFASLSNEGVFESVDTFKEYLKTAGVTVVYKATTEQAFHPLPDEEQELLHNLETYYGVTNVYNDQGCPITLTYISHPQLYVNQKLEQINNALLSLGANI